MQGKLLIFSAPSGSGKTTIVRHLLQKFPNIEFSISACSRPMRNGETHGKDYYFLSVDEFKNRIANNEFIEWEEVYTDSYYGTLKSEIERIWAKKNVVIFDVDVKGGINLKKIFGDNALSIFVMPPSVEDLKLRLVNRNTETEESLKKRVGKAAEEMTYANQFDKILINEILEKSFIEAETLVQNFIKS
ncbi:MAG TPA: guanylate kinase [Bacteroidales bacterium]|nr:guanylate kinase [Bacteroidales bacterium]